ETTYLIVTRDGWIKRQASFTDIEKIRIREGDSIGWIARASTRSTATFFTDRGVAFTLRIDDVQSTTGYGEPIQRHFQFGDGDRVVGVAVHDPKALPRIKDEVKDLYDEENPPPPHGVAVTRRGRVTRFPLALHADLSNRNGRRFMRPETLNDGVLATHVSDGTEYVSVATERGRALCFPVDQANVLKGAGKGVLAIKLRDEDRVLAFELTTRHFHGAHVRTAQGRDEMARPSKHLGKRASRGTVVMKRGKFVEWDLPTMRFDQLRSTKTRPEGEEDNLDELDEFDETTEETTEETSPPPPEPVLPESDVDTSNNGDSGSTPGGESSRGIQMPLVSDDEDEQ
ncbi:MAG: DNA gyrase C-terminal beta-propeller domain-containing protein, partial [Myxococcota bacterium]|nr:DNA gyrase C-terminal beta-propeller domain-containing protein [Myxococcota bacterium]